MTTMTTRAALLTKHEIFENGRDFLTKKKFIVRKLIKLLGTEQRSYIYHLS